MACQKIVPILVFTLKRHDSVQLKRSTNGCTDSMKHASASEEHQKNHIPHRLID